MSANHSRLLLLAACTACCLLSWRGASDASLSFDEAFSWKAVEGRSLSDVVAVTARDVHPPLYYLFLREWIYICGTAPLALRSLSMLFAALCVCAVYALGCEAATSLASDDDGRRRAKSAGLICAALAVANPSLACSSQVARMYSLATLLSVVSGLLLMRALTRPSRCWAEWTGFALATTALVYTHNYGVLVLASEALVAAVSLARRAACGQWSLDGTRKLLGATLAFTTVLVAYLPWLSVLLLQSEQVRSSYWISAVDLSSPFIAWYELLFAPRTKPGPFGGHVWPVQCLLCALPVAISALCLRHPRFAMVFLLAIAASTTALAFLTSVCMTPILVARYLLVVLPFFLVAAGCRLATVTDRTLRLGVLVAAVLLGLQAFQTATSNTVPISVSGSAQAADFIESHRRPDERVLVLGPELYVRYQYYSRNRGAARLLADLREVNHYSGAPVLNASDYFTPQAFSDPFRVWVVSWAASQRAPNGWNRALHSWQREPHTETFLDRQPGHNVYVATYLPPPPEGRVRP
jgi:mannosyltransferase